MIGCARLCQQRGNAGTRILVDAAQAIGNQRAVCTHHGHKVGHRAQRCQVGVFAPQMRHAEARPQGLHHLQRNAHTSQNGVFLGAGPLGVNNGNVNGHSIGRLVMIGDHHAQPLAHRLRHGLATRYAAVNGHNEIGCRTQLHNALERRFR